MPLGIYGFRDGHTHARAHTHTHTRAHTQTHTRAHTHKHTHILACYTRQWHAPGLNLIFITFAAAKG